jgi:hypothetical protein
MVADYYRQFHAPQNPFEPGDRVAYASRVFDEREMTALTDAALDFWLTTGRFSEAMENPAFIGLDDIRRIYLPRGFRHFKIEGRSLGSAVLLEFILYYMTKPECQLKVREAIYLDSELDLF